MDTNKVVWIAEYREKRTERAQIDLPLAENGPKHPLDARQVTHREQMLAFLRRVRSGS